MSLDVYLELKGAHAPGGSGIYIREDGATREISRAEWDERSPGRKPVVALSPGESEEVYSANITHNLGRMAREAGLYEALWRPDEIGLTHAEQLVAPLQEGLALLREEPGRFRQLTPPNGWGSYEALVIFVEQYLAACLKWPGAEVKVWR